MQNHKIYKQFTIGLACGLMMLITTTVTADIPLPQYSLRVIGEQSSPWVLPQAANSATGFQHMPKSWGQQNQERHIEKHDRGFRFVTPEILESLKQQQIQTQLMTENKPRPLMPQQSIQNYGYPSGFQQTPKNWRPQYQGSQIDKHKQGFRFVTPEFLESLMQQQIQTQLLTENKPRPLIPRQSIQNYGYPSGFQQTPKNWRPQYQGSQIDNHKQGFRFVTPEILASLKQQQMQTQLLTEKKQRPLIPRQSIQNYAYPSSGMGFTNPLYDTPAVSPWSSGSGIYGGESSPLVPKEAIGGLSPFHIPPFAKYNGVYESGNTNILKETNVFNPFNIGYYRNIQ